MALRIKQDHSRFRDLVRGKIKENLRKYVAQGEMLGKKGDQTISIPVPRIDLPHFQHDPNQQQGVGQGAGGVGDSIDGESGDGNGPGAGKDGGNHTLEVDVTLEELAQMLGEALALPNIEPKGSQQIVTEKSRYTGIQSQGPQSLRHFRRTYKEALRRELATKPVGSPLLVVPRKTDQRYRSWQLKPKPDSQAAIIYMMDVSGSMGDAQKDLVRITSFWLDLWLRSQYKQLVTRYIVHDAVAREVDRDTFFHTKESGGTMISSAYSLCHQIIEQDLPSSQYNIYPFHFSDGDNWSAEDTKLCMQLLQDKLLPKVNMFCYGQVESPYGSGQFIKDLQEQLVGQHANILCSEIPTKDAIIDAIGVFLGKGY